MATNSARDCQIRAVRGPIRIIDVFQNLTGRTTR